MKKSFHFFFFNVKCSICMSVQIKGIGIYLISGCPYQLACTSTNFGALKLTTETNPVVAQRFRIFGIREIRTCNLMNDNHSFAFLMPTWLNLSLDKENCCPNGLIVALRLEQRLDSNYWDSGKTKDYCFLGRVCGVTRREIDRQKDESDK